MSYADGLPALSLRKGMKEKYEAAIKLRTRNRFVYLSSFLLVGTFICLMSAAKLKEGGSSTFTGAGYSVAGKGIRDVGPSHMNETTTEIFCYIGFGVGLSIVAFGFYLDRIMRNEIAEIHKLYRDNPSAFRAKRH